MEIAGELAADPALRTELIVPLATSLAKDESTLSVEALFSVWLDNNGKC